MTKQATAKCDESIEMATLGVQDIIDLNESRNTNTTTQPKSDNSVKAKRCAGQCERIIGSRWIGFIIGPLYGMFIFYYISYLILDGPPFTIKTQQNIVHYGSGPAQEMGVNALKGIQGIGDQANENDGTNGESANDAPLILDKHLSYVIGAAVGGGTGMALAVGSVFSVKVRCGMMLIIPSLCAKRGRAFMLTAAAGFLLAGPIATIDYNIEQVVNSFTCMYEELKNMADRYVAQYEKIFEDLMKIFDQLNDMIKEYKRHLHEMAENATEDVRRRIKAVKKVMAEKARRVKESLSTLRKVVNAPAVAANWLCEKAVSVVAHVGSAFQKAGRWIGDLFSGRLGRKKRSACRVPDILPDFDLGLPDVNLDALKKFLKKLKPDLNLVDIDLNTIFAELQHSSIADIRLRLKLILKKAFDAVLKYSGYLEKLLYLSIVLVIRDALNYMNRYYADDSFDNKMVDDNLRNLWRNGEKPKIMPLRKWELEQKYQYSAAVYISKSEAKRILINAIPTLIFVMVMICILVTDYALTRILIVFREEGAFGMSYAGMEQGISFTSFLDDMKSGKLDVSTLKLEGFNLTTEPCLPRAKTTDLTSLSVMTTLVVASLVSCIADAYATRLRARICNLYFPERAHERAQYLYKRIQTGRGARRMQLPMIVGREIDRRSRNKLFSTRSRFYALTCARASKETCPGCSSTIARNDESNYSLKRKGKVVEIPICKDCLLDVK